MVEYPAFSISENNDRTIMHCHGINTRKHAMFKYSLAAKSCTWRFFQNFLYPNIPDKKKQEKKRIQHFFSLFSELDQIFKLLHVHLYISVAHLSTSLCPKIHLIWAKSESVISLEIWEGQYRMSQMFQYEVWSPSARRHIVNRCIAPDRKRNACSKIFPFSLPF